MADTIVEFRLLDSSTTGVAAFISTSKNAITAWLTRAFSRPVREATAALDRDRRDIPVIAISRMFAKNASFQQESLRIEPDWIHARIFTPDQVRRDFPRAAEHTLDFVLDTVPGNEGLVRRVDASLPDFLPDFFPGTVDTTDVDDACNTLHRALRTLPSNSRSLVAKRIRDTLRIYNLHELFVLRSAVSTIDNMSGELSNVFAKYVDNDEDPVPDFLYRIISEELKQHPSTQGFKRDYGEMADPQKAQLRLLFPRIFVLHTRVSATIARLLGLDP